MSLAPPVAGFVNAPLVGAGGELENAVTPWLGPANSGKLVGIDGDGNNPHNTFNFPLAFHGQSKAMETLVEFKITKANDWYTSELLPWKKTDSTKFNWTKFKYDRSYFEIEPEGGNPNYIQASVSGGQDQLINRGMAFMIAHEFWKTEMGQNQYLMNLEVLESSARMTVYHLIILAVLKAANPYRNWELRSKNPATTIPQALKMFKIRFAILNRGMHEWRQYQANFVEIMRSRGVEPTILCLPPKTKILMAHGHSSEYDHDKAGAISQDVRKRGEEAFDTIRGLKVYETTPFSETIYGAEHNPLRRIKEIGSFFTIRNFYEGSHLETYKSDDRFSAKVFESANEGQETKVTGKMLFRLSQRFSSNGTLSPAHLQITQENIREDIRKKYGDEPTNTALDMFIGHDPSRNGSNPFYVMEYLGEMRENDFSHEQLKHFAKTASNNLSTLSEKELANISDADQFMEDLNNVDYNMEDHLHYWQAVTYSGVHEDGENYPGADIGIFKNNGSGSINPPTLGQGSIQVKLRGKLQELVFFNNGADKWGVVTSKALLAAKTIDELKALGIEVEDDSVPTTGQTINNNLRTGWTLKKTPELKIAPLGYGSPTGLATLADLYRTKDFRGYKESLLEEAASHYNTLTKFYGIWKNIFDNHDLGTSAACPFYFKSGNEKKDCVTAFGLNLYSHAKYPVFALSPNKNGDVCTFGKIGDLADKTTDRYESVAQAGGWLFKFVNAGLAGAGKAGYGGVDARLTKFMQDSPSAEVKEALLDASIENRLQTNYRGKPLMGKGKPYQLNEFLAFIIANGPNDDKVVSALTAVFEILLRDGYKSPVDWEKIINDASERPIKVGSVSPFSKTAAPAVAGGANKPNGFNTRLCVNPLVFRDIAQRASYLSAADAVSLYRKIPVRPMNIFNPHFSLGSYPTTAGTAGDSLKELRFAAAPLGSNSISSITTSPFFASHLEGSGFVSPHGKRDIADFVETASAPIKRRTVGGVSVGHNYDSMSQTERVFGAVPVSHSTYRSSATDPYVAAQDPKPANTVPANIAFSEAFNIFAFDSSHQDLAGGVHRTRHFRKNLMERFHKFSEESDPKIRIFAQSWITSRIKLQTFEKMWEANTILPFSFELHRIRQRYYMGSGFIAQGGPKLGFAHHGFHSFEWSDDIIRKIHVGRYNFRFAATIQDERRVGVCEDIVAMGSLGRGEELLFCNGPEDFNLLLTDPDSAMTSTVVKMVPYNREMPSMVQDIAGRWNGAVVAQCSENNVSDPNKIHGESVYFYEHLYKFSRINHGAVSRSTDFRAPNYVINTTVWRGHHRIYNPVTQKSDTLVLDKGPFGSNVYQGVMRARDIYGNPIKECNFETTANIFN